MLWNRNFNHILEDWTESLDYSREAGGMPLFDMGLSHNTLDGLLSLTAVQDFSSLAPPGISRPVITIGGNSPLWLLVLDSTWLAGEHQTSQPSVQTKFFFDTAFTAIDPATHIASLTTSASSNYGMSSRSPKEQATGLPSAFRAYTIPQLEPAVISTWQALPLTISLPKPQLRGLYSIEQSGPSLTTTEQQGRVAYSKDESDSLPSEIDNELALVALVVCILLILVALV